MTLDPLLKKLIQKLQSLLFPIIVYQINYKSKIFFYFQLPEATSILGLALPHFMLGLGIGIIDSALMPLLATLIDEEEHGKAYGSVYAIGGRSQTMLTRFCPLLNNYLVLPTHF